MTLRESGVPADDVSELIEPTPHILLSGLFKHGVGRDLRQPTTLTQIYRQIIPLLRCIL